MVTVKYNTSTPGQTAFSIKGCILRTTLPIEINSRYYVFTIKLKSRLRETQFILYQFSFLNSRRLMFNAIAIWRPS